jgi:hypothetical protein
LRSKARSGEIVVRGVVYRGSEDMVARCCCSWVGDRWLMHGYYSSGFWLHVS